MKTADIAGALIGMTIGGYVVWESSTMPTDVVMKIGPGFFPQMMAGGLILFCLILLINALRGRSQGTVEPMRLSDVGVQRGLITLVAAVAFVALMVPLGFIPTAIAFLTFMMLVMGKRKPLPILVIPSLVTASIWLVFEKGLHLGMPPGLLERFL